MHKNQIIRILMFIALISVLYQPVSANDSIKQMNVTVVSDLNQTAGNDIISLVDTDRLDIGSNPDFAMRWSPDGSRMLIGAFVNAYPKGKPQHGGISALYAANADGSGITRIAWAETTSNSGGNILMTPAWSQSGDYFIYMELVEGGMHRLKSAHLYIISDTLNTIDKIKFGSYPSVRPLSSFAWSPKEDRIAVLEPTKIFIRDLDRKTNFSMPVDYIIIEELAWSPDGEKIAFVKDNRDVFILDVEGRELNKIFSAELVGAYSVRWSPDSKKLIFYEIKGSGEGNVSYVVYVMDDDGVKKIITLGTCSLEQWYPDSERILIKICSNSCALHSLSMTGEMEKLIESKSGIDGMVGHSGFISAISPNPGSKIPPYVKTYDLFLLNDSDKLTIENVTYYLWKDTDVLFVKDGKISILNVTTQDIWEVSVPAKNFTKVRWDPSDFTKVRWDPKGRFIAVEGYIIELHAYSNHIRMAAGNNINSTVHEVMTIKNPMDEQSRATTAKEPSELSGFAAIIAFIGLLIALGYIRMKD